MPRLKKVDYPETRMDDAIEAVKVLEEKFSGEATNVESFAAALDHKTAKSGTFLKKLADLRKWGLVERSAIKSTHLTKKIIYPKSDIERNEARLEMLLHVSLFKTIFERLKGQPPGDDFWILLQEITNIDRADAQKEAHKISNIYKDALNKIHVEKHSSPQYEKGRPMTTPLQEGMFEANFGDVYIKIPNNKQGIEELEALVPLIKKRILGKPEKEQGK